MNRSNYQRFWAIAVIGVILVFSKMFGVLTLADWQPDLQKMSAQAKEAYYAGNLDKSLETYREILKYEPDGRSSLQMASIYEEKGDYLQATKSYEIYLQYHSNDSQARLDLAIARYNQGNYTSAEKDLFNLLQKEDLDYVFAREAAYYLSKINQHNGQYQKAIIYADQALKADSKFALATIQKGWIYELLGETDQAINNYLAGLTLDGSLKGVQRQLGLLYFKKKDYTKAYDRFDKALDENDNDLVSKAKLEWLETEFPGKYKRSTAPPEPKNFPETVKFEQISPLAEAAKITKIRVGLAGGDSQKVVIFRVGSDFQVKDLEGEVLTTGEAGDIWMAELTGKTAELVNYPDGKPLQFTSPIRIEPVEYVPILIHQVQFGEGYYWSGKQDRQYRGQIELMPKTDGLAVVNIVNVEDYLYSVVASEMPSSWPLEALKVQAVAARTYTYFNLGKHKSAGYDLCDTVHCAAYNGISWESNSTRLAVNETLGEVMTYNGRPINAVYSSNSGGHTEDAKDVWGFDLPYLKGVSTLIEDSEVFPLEPADLKDWLRKRPGAYSADPRFANMVQYRWQRRVTRSFIEDRLNIGKLQELKVTGRGIGGSVISMLVIGDKGEIELKNSLRSNLGGLRSNRFFFRPEYENGQLSGYIFYGGGWGHSAGMDQVAAAGMARDGINYDDILKHFYTGIDLEKKY